MRNVMNASKELTAAAILALPSLSTPLSLGRKNAVLSRLYPFLPFEKSVTEEP
jgi:hypothetical protein